MSKETQREIHDLNAASAKKLTALLEKYIDTFNASCIRRGLSWYGDKVDYETAKWVLLIREFDNFVWSAHKSSKIPHTKRPDSGEWDITGYEMTDFAQPLFIGQHGMGNFKYNFSQYKFQWNDLQRNHPAMLSETEVDCFNAVCGGNTDNCDADTLASLERYGYIRKNGDGYELSIVVLPKDKNDMFTAGLTETELQTMRDCHIKITAIISDIEKKAEAIIHRDMPPKVLENPRHFADVMGSAFNRGYVFEQAIADGWLKYDEFTPKSVGAFIIK